MLRSGVIGTGALGRHHVRILAEMPEAELVGVCDLDHGLAQELADRHDARVFSSPRELLDQVDCVVIATPTVSHRDLGVEALAAGCHVMVEKPMATTLKEADELLAAADAAGRVLCVGHVEFYNPAVQRLLEMGLVPRFVEIQRLSTFSPRSLDVDVILDLMIHDLQIVQALCLSEPLDVRAVGIKVLSPRVDMADARLEFEPGPRGPGCVASLRASRVSDTKVRQLRLFSDRFYCSLDYQEQTIKAFDLQETPEEEGPSSQSFGLRKIVPVKVEVTPAEPLRSELEHFLAACRGEDVRLVNGVAGRQALELALRIATMVGSDGTSP